MISIIICSKTPNIPTNLFANIEQTIGTEYELITINNSNNRHSLCSAYNEGIKKAKGTILCFMHTDILFETKDWGLKVEQILKDQSIGCVGIIGSYYLQKDYGYWDMMIPYTTGYVPCKIGIVDMNKFTNHGDQVVAVDGMWFCIPQKMFNQISFDDKTFTDFHFYDMDICMQINILRKKIIIARDLIIYHYCNPQYNTIFYDNMKKFYNKWNNYLPIAIGIEVDKDTTETISRWCRRMGHYYLPKELEDVYSSFSFKLGKFLTAPFRWIKKKITSK